jgi:hypothetical protein
MQRRLIVVIGYFWLALALYGAGESGNTARGTVILRALVFLISLAIMTG